MLEPATLLALLQTLLSSLCFVGLFLANRFYSRKVNSNLLTAFLFSMIVGAGNALIFLVISLFLGFPFDVASLPYVFGVGGLFILSQVIGVLALSLGNMSIYSQVFMVGGMVLPFVYGLFNGDELRILPLLGIILMLFTLAMPVLDDLRSKQKKSKKEMLLFFLCCFASFFVNGSICVVNSAHTLNVPSTSIFSYTCLYSLVCCLFGTIGFFVTSFILKKKNPAALESRRTVLHFLPVLFASLYGLCYSFGSVFSMFAVQIISPGIVFPVSNAIVMISTFLLSWFALKEKPGLFAKIGAILLIPAVILFVL